MIWAEHLNAFASVHQFLSRHVSQLHILLLCSAPGRWGRMLPNSFMPSHLLCVSFHPAGTQEVDCRAREEEGLIPFCALPTPMGIPLVLLPSCSPGRELSLPGAAAEPSGWFSSTGGASFIPSQPQRHQLPEAHLQASTFS